MMSLDCANLSGMWSGKHTQMDQVCVYIKCMSCLGSVTILRDKSTRVSKGVAFVLYLKPEEAQIASGALHGKRSSAHHRDLRVQGRRTIF